MTQGNRKQEKIEQLSRDPVDLPVEMIRPLQYVSSLFRGAPRGPAEPPSRPQAPCKDIHQLLGSLGFGSMAQNWIFDRAAGLFLKRPGKVDDRSGGQRDQDRKWIAGVLSGLLEKGCIERQNFERGEVLFERGEEVRRNPCFYLVVNGRVSIGGRKKNLKVRTVGEEIGDQGVARRKEVRALGRDDGGPTVTLRFDYKRMLKYLRIATSQRLLENLGNIHREREKRRLDPNRPHRTLPEIEATEKEMRGAPDDSSAFLFRQTLMYGACLLLKTGSLGIFGQPTMPWLVSLGASIVKGAMNIGLTAFVFLSIFAGKEISAKLLNIRFSKKESEKILDHREGWMRSAMIYLTMGAANALTLIRERIAPLPEPSTWDGFWAAVKEPLAHFFTGQPPFVNLHPPYAAEALAFFGVMTLFRFVPRLAEWNRGTKGWGSIGIAAAVDVALMKGLDVFWPSG